MTAAFQILLAALAIFLAVKFRDAIPSAYFCLSVLFSLWVMVKISAWFLQWSVKRYCNLSPPNVAIHHFIRDSGLFHHLMAIMSISTIKTVLLLRPDILWHSVRLAWSRKTLRYGQHSPSQIMELFLPPPHQQEDQRPAEGVVVFVHGGAWGSGSPSMYRLLALPLEPMNWAVAVVGYRIYPEGDASSQIQDLEMAMKVLQREHPEICQRNVCLMGHSSGSHIALLTLVERLRHKLELHRAGNDTALQQWENSLVKINSFVGVSGPYNIFNHFDFEASRGVEQISPMQPACGNSREKFLRYSPAVQLSHLTKSLSSKERNLLSGYFPKMTLIHGMEDSTVPYSSSKEAARIFKTTGFTQCAEIYEKDVGHEEAILQIMLCGPIQDIVTETLTIT